MAAYIIVLADVTDREQYAKYAQVTPAAIAKFGGRFIVRAGRTETLEGAPENRRVVVIEFPSFEQAKAFYHSDEYTRARALRAGAANASFILVEGVHA